MIGIFADNLFWLIILNLPAYLLLCISGLSIKKYNRYSEELQDLGYKLSNIKGVKSARLFFMIPGTLLFLLFSVLILMKSMKLVYVNVSLFLISLVLIIYFEAKIYRLKSRWGVYINGICTHRGVKLFAVIPQIEITSAREIQILDTDGVQKKLVVNEYAVNSLKLKYPFVDNKYVNAEWSNEIRKKTKPVTIHP